MPVKNNRFRLGLRPDPAIQRFLRPPNWKGRGYASVSASPPELVPYFLDQSCTPDGWKYKSWKGRCDVMNRPTWVSLEIDNVWRCWQQVMTEMRAASVRRAPAGPPTDTSRHLHTHTHTHTHCTIAATASRTHHWPPGNHHLPRWFCVRSNTLLRCESCVRSM